VEEVDGEMIHSPNDFGTFFIPGPTEVRRDVLSAMMRPMIPHRSREFEELFARLQVGLQEIFRTARPVFISAASATGMMEAGIRCTPSGPILSLVNGAFSERFAHIAEKCGRQVERYEVDWGRVHDPGRLDVYLTRQNFRAITVVHSETSTGALNDIRQLSDVAHSRGVVCLVDSVSGVGGAELETDRWQLDYVLTGSQKALAVPPGLAFSVASQGFLDAAQAAENRGVYFDLVEMEHFASRGQVLATPALSLLYALEAQLDAIRVEGIEKRWKRHQAMAEMTSQWLDDCRERHGIDVENIVDREHRSPTVSTIRLPRGLGAEEFVERVASRGIRVASGYGKLKPATFRIGHMGDHSPATLRHCLTACGDTLKS
jgi:aspartate aminotransferase-like enzyme